MNIAAPISTKHCKMLPALFAYFDNFQFSLEHKPNGQKKYTFSDGLVLNVYETGSVVFQGPGANGALAYQIAALIDQLNVSVPAF